MLPSMKVRPLPPLGVCDTRSCFHGLKGVDRSYSRPLYLGDLFFVVMKVRISLHGPWKFPTNVRPLFRFITLQATWVLVFSSFFPLHRHRHPRAILCVSFCSKQLGYVVALWSLTFKRDKPKYIKWALRSFYKRHVDPLKMPNYAQSSWLGQGKYLYWIIE